MAMTIIHCFEEWQLELELMPHSIRLLSDHKKPRIFYVYKAS